MDDPFDQGACLGTGPVDRAKDPPDLAALGKINQELSKALQRVDAPPDMEL